MTTRTDTIPPPQSGERAQWLTVVVLCTLFVGVAVLMSSGALVDDAYIAIRYSLRLARGAGLTFQEGAPVEGYTCFSWVVLGALFEKLGLPAAAGLPLFGIGCGAATVAVATRAAQRWSASPQSWRAGIVPGAFLVCSPGLAYYSGSGLETGLYVLLVLLSLVASIDGRPRGAALAGALCFLTRPEGALVCVLALALGGLRAEPARRREWYVAGSSVALLAGAYAAFKLGYFGALLPNTAVAKPPGILRGLAYVGEQAIDAGPLLLLTAALSARRLRAAPRHAWCLVGALVLALLCVAEGGDWMNGNRLLLPALVVTAPALALLPTELRAASARARGVLGVLVFAASGLFLYGSWFDVRLLSSTSAIVASYEPVRDDIAQRLVQSGVRSVGTLDIGRISYTAETLRLFDLGGLTDRDVARVPGDYHDKQVPESLLRAHAPDAFLFAARRLISRPSGPPLADFHYPVEAGVAGTAWFQERYQLHAASRAANDYFLCWYARRPGAPD